MPTKNAWQAATWHQFGAAIDTLARVISSCPESLWSDRSRRPEFWYVAFHTIFFLDYYLADDSDRFRPPTPFTLDELHPDGRLPERPYTKAELSGYLAHCRARCRQVIASMTDERAKVMRTYRWGSLSNAELLGYNMRHVQHHTGQLILLLRQVTDSTPGWVVRAEDEF